MNRTANIVRRKLKLSMQLLKNCIKSKNIIFIIFPFTFYYSTGTLSIYTLAYTGSPCSKSSGGGSCLSLEAWRFVKARFSSFVIEGLWLFLLYWFQNCSLLSLVLEAIIVDEDEHDEEKLDTEEDLDLKENLARLNF